ncbi:MAG: hypothetical protein HC788_10590 [Sphingopyxis sp.]|nr:hypothetical protein [Sphingopyxis sp.]
MVDAAQPDTARMAQLRGALERELGPDEDVLWHGWHLGQIDPRDFMIYVFAVPWTAFSIAWTGIAAMAIAGSGEDGPGLIGWAFPLFGLPFIAVGLWMLSRPLPCSAEGPGAVCRHKQAGVEAGHGPRARDRHGPG